MAEPLDYESQKPKEPRVSWLPLILLLGFMAWIFVMFITNHGD